jgi:hypothetical protein
MNDIPRTLLPLGVFGRGWPSSESERVRRELLPLVGKLSEDECPLIARYLRAGTVVFALMEWTTDVIGAFPEPKLEKFRPGFHILEAVGGRFDVAGGSGILTDGTYYWRTDTADYVEHYSPRTSCAADAHGDGSLHHRWRRRTCSRCMNPSRSMHTGSTPAPGTMTIPNRAHHEGWRQSGALITFYPDSSPVRALPFKVDLNPTTGLLRVQGSL